MTYIDDLLGDQRTFLDELLEEITMNLDNLKRFPENKTFIMVFACLSYID